MKRWFSVCRQHNPVVEVEWHYVSVELGLLRVLLHAPHDARVNMEQRWKDNDRVQQWLGEKLVLVSPFPPRTNLDASPGFLCEKPATDLCTACRTVSAPVSYSENSAFESRPGGRISWPFFVVIFSLSIQMLGQWLKLGHGNFHQYFFINHLTLTA